MSDCPAPGPDPKPGPGPAKAKLGGLTVSAPKSVRRRKKARFSVSVRNVGTAAATGVSLRVTRSKRRLATRKLGRIDAGTARKLQVRMAFPKRGRARLTFTVAAANAGRATTVKTVRVR